MRIRRSLAKMLFNCFSCSSSAVACCFICINNNSIQNNNNVVVNAHHQLQADEDDDEQDFSGRISLVNSGRAATESSSSVMLKLKDVVLYDRNNMHNTLAFQLKPKMVTLRVSMHCHGCAKKVQKHISKMDGVTSYKVDLENKLVVIVGDIFPVEVLQSVSKVIKYTELWNPSLDNLDSTNFTAYF